MPYSYADSPCQDCGKKIVTYRAMNDRATRPLDFAVNWREVQKKYAVRCIHCARKIATAAIAEMEASGEKEYMW